MRSARTLSPRDRSAIDRYARAFNRFAIRRMVLWLAAFDILFWLTDPFVFRGQPGVIRTFAVGRGVILASFCLHVIVGRWPPLRRSPLVAGALLSVVLASAVGYLLGEIGGPDGPWFHYGYLIALAPLVTWMTPWARVACTVAVGYSYVAGYFLCHPRYVGHPFFATSCAHMTFTAAISVLLGIQTDALRSRAFLFRRDLVRQAGKLDAEVAERTQELSALAVHLEGALEEERRRVARELHDEMGQELTAMRYAVKLLRMRYSAEAAAAPPELDQIGGLLDSATATMRTIVSDLWPRVLDDLGLAAAVEWLARTAEERAGIACRVDVTGAEGDMPKSVAAAAFRVVQEALTNVLKHASATSVDVVVHRDDGALHLLVMDDGIGFDPEPAARRRRVTTGIFGMRERVRALSGEFRVEGRKPRGTVVSARLPLAEELATGPEAAA